MSHYETLRAAITAAVDAAWTTTNVAYGRPEKPIPPYPRGVVQLGEVSRKGMGRMLHQTWPFTIWGVFDKADAGESPGWEAYQVEKAESLAQELAPFLENGGPGVPPAPLGGVGFSTEVTEWETIEPDDADAFLVVRVVLQTTTEVSR